MRYRLSATPVDAGWCHCRTCQLNSGSPAMAFATVPVRDYRIEQGAELIGSIASSDAGHRTFCTRCGTPLLMRDGATPDTLDFSIATLDEPEAVTPGFHIFCASAIAWAVPRDDLPRYPRSRREGPMSTPAPPPATP